MCPRSLNNAVFFFSFLLSFVATPVSASHSIFSYAVDRFEVTGNSQGTRFDDFDDGLVAPWGILLGTAVEQDGTVILKNPGTEVDVMTFLYPGLILDRSDITSPPAFDVSDGLGNFTATSIWTTGLINAGDYESFSFQYGELPGEFKGIGVAFANVDPAVASALGVPSGLIISQSQFTADTSGPNSSVRVVTYESQGVSILPGELVSDLHMRLIFDDATNQVTTAFSLDGGSTFQIPFAPFTAPAFGTGTFALGADPLAFASEPVPVAGPLAQVLLGLGLLTAGMRWFRN